jgi:hypothetical protein
LRAKECVPNSLLFRCFHFRLTFESIKELGSASTLRLVEDLREFVRQPK